MTEQAPLVLAVADHDLNRLLIDGTVRPEGRPLQIVWDLDDGVRHRRMQREGAFDACEFSFGNYLQLRAADAPFHGIPVFPNRKFRHPYVFVNRAAGVREPRDLAGKRVGLRDWGNTASLWVRGILARFYGLDLARVGWAALREPTGVRLPAGVRVEALPADADLDALLVAGALDAVIAPDVLPSVQHDAPEVGRIFEDYRTAEQEFYARTRIFPISHLVILKDAVVREDPAAPLRLLRLFRASRDACFRRIEEQQLLALSWAGALLAEQRALMGPHYWPYNVADNRLVLETLLTFAHEQGLIPRPLTVEELFVPDTLTAPGV
jgi:4,5-dihydroxyphthalate decarboxylase